MGKNLKFLRLFTIHYWERRINIMNRWKARKTSIKHLFINGMMIEKTINPDFRKDYTSLFIEYRQITKTINIIHDNERMVLSLEHIN